ncbi:hypothetical protein Pcinc_030207 [Petrolisthes cinctipes]|uniref:Uncharacterized protein n=1 Tax=Petrolisthes cinctipes TaxID=88211 RepID=A0AAE1EYV4_PETCI|nr:hypothetical protein Pcinc_030207 [Petrolisthes cinctipes]
MILTTSPPRSAVIYFSAGGTFSFPPSNARRQNIRKTAFGEPGTTPPEKMMREQVPIPSLPQCCTLWFTPYLHYSTSLPACLPCPDLPRGSHTAHQVHSYPEAKMRPDRTV